jgi:hypothetical protein
MSPLAEWVLSAALTFAPIERQPQWKGYEETREEAFDRYITIANDIAAAAEGEAKSELGAKQRAALLLAVAVGESGLALDVDRGPCYRQGGYKLRCDGGTSFTLWQLKHAIVDGQPVRGRELEGTANRPRAARGALRAILGSLGMCKKLAPEDRLSGYGVGRCVAGNKSVRARWALYQRVVAHVADDKAGR